MCDGAGGAGLQAGGSAGLEAAGLDSAGFQSPDVQLNSGKAGSDFASFMKNLTQSGQSNQNFSQLLQPEGHSRHHHQVG